MMEGWERFLNNYVGLKDRGYIVGELVRDANSKSPERKGIMQKIVYVGRGQVVL